MADKIFNFSSDSGNVIIFDCDPGIDDAIALFLFSGFLKRYYQGYEPKIYVVATWGNVPLSKTLVNAKICVGLFGIPAKVVSGMEKPVEGEARFFAEKVHGEDGLRGAQKYFLSDAVKEHIKLDDMIEEISSDEVKNIYVIATGPLSSVSKTLEIKRVREKIKRVVWMGGAFFHDGNITPWAEFNAYCDPTAMKILFEFAKEKKCVEVVPLDATEKTQIKTKDFLNLFQISEEKRTEMKEIDEDEEKERYNNKKKNPKEEEKGKGKKSYEKIAEGKTKREVGEKLDGKKSPDIEKRGERIQKFMKMITEGTGTIILHDPLAVFSFFMQDKVKHFISVSHVDTKAFAGKINSIITPNGFLKVVYDFDKNSFIEEIGKAFQTLSSL